MAKKSKRRGQPRPPRFAWRKPDVRKLIACLDYSLEHGVDFNSTAINYIARTTGTQVTEKLIEQALRRECYYHGRRGRNYTFEDFLAEGSTFLVQYTEHERELIRGEISRIETPPGRYRLRRTPQTWTPRSRTLSSNPPPRSTTSSLSSLSATPEFEGIGDYLAEADHDETSIVPRNQEHNAVPQDLDLTCGNRGGSRASTRTASLPARLKVEDGLALAVDNCKGPSRASPAIANHENRIRVLERELAAKHEELDAALRDNMEQKQHIFTLSSRLSAAEKECRAIQSSFANATEYKDNIEIQKAVRVANYNLTEQIIKMNAQRKAIAQLEAGSSGPSLRTIREEFELLTMNLKDACWSFDITLQAAPTDVTGTEPGTNMAEAWSRRLAGCNFHQLVTDASRWTDIPNPKYYVVRSLVAAGVSDLLFESRFPDFLARESPLLDQYREHLLASAGPQTLSQLDLLACQSVMSQSYFQSRIIPNTAREIANKLYDSLANIMSPKKQTRRRSRSDGLSLFGEQAHPAENPPAELFMESLVPAVKLKAGLLLSRSKYKLVFFRPGHRFDPDTMTRDGHGHTSSVFVPKMTRAGKEQPSQHEDDSGEVKLCLFPALYSRPHAGPQRQYGVGVNVRNCLVDCENFVTAEADEDLEGFDLVVKAVVLV